MLKDKEPGSFIVRDSHSFRGAYGLAMKVATPPPSVLQLNRKAGDLASELVRHFLVECTPRGVRLKGCPNEPYFDPLEEVAENSPQTAANSAAELLKQGAGQSRCPCPHTRHGQRPPPSPPTRLPSRPCGDASLSHSRWEGGHHRP